MWPFNILCINLKIKVGFKFWIIWAFIIPYKSIISNMAN